MTTKLNIGAAFSYGIDRLTTRGGAVLVVAYVLFQLVTQVTTQSLFLSLLSESVPDEDFSQMYPLAMDLPVGVSGGLLILLMIAGTALAVVATRALYADIDSVPSADHMRRLVPTVAVLIVVTLITFVAVLFGSLLFLFPGIFLGVSLVFAHIAVAVEDAGIIESLQRSWTLTSGNRLRLFALGFSIFVATGTIWLIFGVLGSFFPVVGAVVSMILIGIVSLFGVAVLVGAFRQLADVTGSGGSPEW